MRRNSLLDHSKRLLGHLEVDILGKRKLLAGCCHNGPLLELEIPIFEDVEFFAQELRATLLLPDSLQ